MTLLDVRGLTFTYPAAWDVAAEPFALKDISFTLSPGELLGVLGPNGSGKSTLLRILGKFLIPAQGEILLDGLPLARLAPREVARQVAVVPQEISTVFAVTVEQMVSLGLYPQSDWFGWISRQDENFVGEILRQTDLWPLRHRLTTQLSGGERRRVLLARALAQRPKLLLLDEPTAHLDPRHQVEFVALVDRLRREKDLAVVAVLHDIHLALSWCPRILMLKGGRVAAQGPARTLLEPALFETIYGLPAQMAPLPGKKTFVDFFHFIQHKGATS